MTDKKQDDPSKIFTYDPDAEASTEAPSLTRLLNRKSLSQKKTTSAQNLKLQQKLHHSHPLHPTRRLQAPLKSRLLRLLNLIN